MVCFAGVAELAQGGIRVYSDYQGVVDAWAQGNRAPRKAANVATELFTKSASCT